MNRILLALAAASLISGSARANPCNPRMSRSAPDSRYQDNGNGTVTDRRTGLTWQRCPLGMTWSDGGTPGFRQDDHCVASGATALLWQAALQAASDLNAAGGFAGFSDWRLPNAKELASLFETACYGPALNDRIFPDTPSGTFYSSTPYIQGTTTSSSVHGCSYARAGSCGPVGKTGTPRPVRLVRG
jgi:hypothetical protein